MTKVRLNDLIHALMFVSFSESPENRHDVGEYLPIPDKRDLDLGNRLVFAFTQQYLPDRYDEVRSMFRKHGAYARFKALVERQGMLERWYAFSNAEEAHALREWCRDKGFELEEWGTGGAPRKGSQPASPDGKRHCATPPPEDAISVPINGGKPGAHYHQHGVAGEVWSISIDPGGPMSGGEIMILGKLILTFGGLITFGLWELYQLRR